MPDFESHQRQPGSEDITRPRLSRRRAIRARCLDCSAWSTKEVAKCQMTKCALYPFRMGKGKQNPEQRSKAIRRYCKWCCGDSLKEVRLCTSTDCPLYPFRMVASSRQDAPLLQKNTIYGGNSEDRKSDECDGAIIRGGL